VWCGAVRSKQEPEVHMLVYNKKFVFNAHGMNIKTGSYTPTNALLYTIKY